MHKSEKFNSLTHVLGIFATLAGGAVLVTMASLQGDPIKIVSFSIYGASLFFLYLFSVLYHSNSGSKKNIFQKLDHSAIYFLIAGTYTPISLVTLAGAWGWTLFGIIWGLAVAGLVQDAVLKKRRKGLSITIYLVMGWMAIIAIVPLLERLAAGGFWLLLAGGLFYSGGVYFYVRSNKHWYYHGIWHLFVLAGSISHFLCIIIYIL